MVTRDDLIRDYQRMLDEKDATIEKLMAEILENNKLVKENAKLRATLKEARGLVQEIKKNILDFK